MTVRKTAAADTADEAQQPVEPAVAADDSRAKTTLEMIENGAKVLKARIKADYDPELRDVKERLDNLEALAEAKTDEGDDAITTLATALAKLEERVGEQREADGGAAVGEAFAELSDRINNLAATTGQELARVRDEVRNHAAPAVGTYAGGLGAARKVLKLMQQVTEIGKGRQANLGEGGNYAFRGVDDAMNAVGSAMRTVGLILRQEVVDASHGGYNVDKISKDGRKYGTTFWATTRVHMRYVFVDPDDGSEHPVEGYGVGKDPGDKDGSKAMAAAMKYALFQGLCIPVKGMNIDAETEHPDSGSEQYAPEPESYPDEPAPEPESQERPQTDLTAEQQCAHLLTWLRAPGRTKEQLDKQWGVAARKNVLAIQVADPQTGNVMSLEDHLRAIRPGLADG